MKRINLIYNFKSILFAAGLILIISGTGCAHFTSQSKPNIVYILADDLGYGDVHCLNPERGKILTPHIDHLAVEGMTFTDVHSGSSVCTPTRYGIITGRYCWRTRLQKRVLYGYDKPLIAKDRLTVAGLLKQQGYRTAGFGKWHLGLNIPTKNGKPARNNDPWQVDWQGTIGGGPYDLGFDYYYGISASLDMHPYIFFENNHFDGICTTEKAFHRKGPAQEDFEAVQVLSTLKQKAVSFIEKQTAAKPFFAYVALTAPHTPIVPEESWRGKSGIGKYGDFVMQVDSVVGEIVAAIDRTGLKDNTIVIVTSDNGCSKAADIPKLQSQGHYPSAQFRGAKLDLLDGGHRIPFIVRWPQRIKAGSSCDQLVCLTDLMATCADLTHSKLPENAGEDSVSFLPALSGEPIVSTRAGIIHHSYEGYFAYRQGKWKLLLARGSGGATHPTEDDMPPGSPEMQLYDMENDPGETTNLQGRHPEIVKQLLELLESDVKRGRSRAGKVENNDVEQIILWKNRLYPSGIRKSDRS